MNIFYITKKLYFDCCWEIFLLCNRVQGKKFTSTIASTVLT